MILDAIDLIYDTLFTTLKDKGYDNLASAPLISLKEHKETDLYPHSFLDKPEISKHAKNLEEVYDIEILLTTIVLTKNPDRTHIFQSASDVCESIITNSSAQSLLFDRSFSD